MKKNLWRGVVALATAIACLGLAGSPTSAVTLVGEITAGTVTLINSTGTATDTIPLTTGGTLGTGCASNLKAFVNNTTTSTTTWQVTEFNTIGRFKLGTTWYIAELTKTGSASGTVTTVTTTTATLNSATLALSANIYTATDQSDTATTCAHGTTRTCRFANVSLSLQGTYSGNLHTPAVSDGVSLTSTGTLGTTTPPCNAPYTTYNGGTVTVTGMTAQVTAAAATLAVPITGGTSTLINSTGTVTDAIPLGTAGGTGTGCLRTLQAIANNTPTSATFWQITALHTKGRFKVGTTWYIAEQAMISSTPGTITGITTTSATLNAAGVIADLVISTATTQSDTATDCGTTTTVCRYSTVTLSKQGTYNGNIHTPGASITVNLTGTGTLGPATGCSAPFTTYNNGTMTVTSLTATVTSVT